MRSRAVIAVAVLAGALGTGGWLLQRGLAHGSLGYVGAKLFDDVLVMAEDEGLRHARLALVAALRDLILGIADISEIVTEA